MSIIPATRTGRVKNRNPKPDELLSSVVRETAPAGVVELLRANSAFTFPSGTSWVVLTLDVEDLLPEPGLCRRSRGEAKGSVIELIDSDQIQTVATKEMLDGQTFGIIPNANTLERMSEFSLLVEPKYTWGIVWVDESGVLMVDPAEHHEASFRQATEVLSGKLTLEAAVGPKAWATHSGVVPEPVAQDTAEPVTEPLQSEDPIFDEQPGAQDESSRVSAIEIPDVLDDAEENPEGFDEAYAFDEAEAAPVVEEQTESFDEFDEDEDDPHYGDVDDDVDPEALGGVLAESRQVIYDTIARRFLAEELEIDVDLAEFNTSFGVDAPAIQIEVPEGASAWLGDQIAQLTRQANAEIRQLHYVNNEALRGFYIQLVSKHIEQVLAEVSFDTEGSRYKRLVDATEQIHQKRLEEKPEQVRGRIAEINKEFEANAKRAGEQAAMTAEMQYKERHRPKIERAHVDAAADLERQLEDEHSHARAEILRVRKTDARVRIDRGKTQIFSVVGEQKKALLDAETALIEKWNDQLKRLIEDHRGNDVTHAKALAEHQARVDEIGVMRAEHDQVMAKMLADQEATTQRREVEFQQELDDVAARMKARAIEWQGQLDLEKSRAESYSRQLNDALEQMSKIGENYESQYKAEVGVLKEELEARQRSIEFSNAVETRARKLSNGLYIALLLVLPVLFLVAGFIWGSGQN